MTAPSLRRPGAVQHDARPVEPTTRAPEGLAFRGLTKREGLVELLVFGIDDMHR
jgi:hypothetical protein